MVPSSTTIHHTHARTHPNTQTHTNKHARARNVHTHSNLHMRTHASSKQPPAHPPHTHAHAHVNTHHRHTHEYTGINTARMTCRRNSTDATAGTHHRAHACTGRASPSPRPPESWPNSTTELPPAAARTTHRSPQSKHRRGVQKHAFADAGRREHASPTQRAVTRKLCE